MVRHVLALVAVSTIAGCTTEIVTWEEPPQNVPSQPDDDGEDGDPRSRDRDRDDDDDDDDDGDDDDDDDDDFQLGVEVGGIPAGQMPPPGSCRIWHPNRSPGQQPPAGACDELRRRVPEDAWLLYRPTAEPRVYRID
jgi:hypothetical protein